MVELHKKLNIHVKNRRVKHFFDVLFSSYPHGKQSNFKLLSYVLLMKTIYISMPTKKFEDQSVIGGKRTLLNKKAVCKFQIFGVNISSFCAKKIT